MTVEIAVPALGAIMVGADGVHHADESESPVSVEFRYDPTDPAAVRLVFLAGEVQEDEMEWVFSRELLREVLISGTAGSGDVKLTRVLYGPISMERIAFWLSNGEGSALIYFKRHSLTTLAEQIELRLPSAELERAITEGLDAELVKLLEEA